MLVVAAAAWLAGILLEAWGQAWISSMEPDSSGGMAGRGSSGVLVRHHPLAKRQEQGQAWLIALLVASLLLGAWRYTTVSPAADPAAIRAYIGTKALVVRWKHRR